ncbi:ATP-binding protein [Winogradskyella maritima]|uniref:histidine kinase n=1 Tax=Winogradskyella maritima TaxID=1517766 RepID=A0ABV8AGC8_9FLAO|nr:ATP-binding protein [Winogradskyella maritima]
MPQLKHYILAVFLAFAGFTIAQNGSQQDADKLAFEVEQLIDQAQIQSDRGDYFDAKDNLEKAKDIAISINDRKSVGFIHTKLAKLHFFVDESDKALSALAKATEIQRDINDNPNLALTYNVQGYIHNSRGEYTTALEYFNSARSLFNDEGLDKYLSELTLNEARSYYHLENFKASKDKLEEVIISAKKHDQQRTLSTAYILSAKVAMKLDNLDIAMEQAEEGLQLATQIESQENINDAYLTMSQIYEAQQNFKDANVYLNRHLKLSDSLLNIQRENLSPEKQAQYVTKYRNAENKNLKEQIDEADAEENLSRITTILSISLITILSLLTLSLYKNNNIRLRTNNMLHKKNDELIVAKEKAELASKTKANFLSTVTHELRTPLYAVTGLTNMLLEEEPKEKQIPHLKSLKFSGDYLLTFINDILQINKIEANKVELDPEQFNLRKKLENVISALNNSALDNNIKVHLEYGKGLPETFFGDQLKLSQILINLLGNAIKFTKDGDIWVRAFKEEQDGDNYRLRFEVEDNGIGISKEKQGQMFESFSQGSVQINRKYGGTGLGLSIVKGLIEILKGKIWLKSELGKGTTFLFEIPLKYAEPKKVVPKVSEHAKNIKNLDLTNIKILVVEDNKINQMITKKILNKMGLYCDVVDNGEEAVERVRDTEYNVVLMDIHMPGISGLEATKRIRTFDKELTIFALTAVTLEDKMHEFDEAGFDDIISKPFKQEDFEKKLYNELSGTGDDKDKVATPL